MNRLEKLPLNRIANRPIGAFFQWDDSLQTAWSYTNPNQIKPSGAAQPGNPSTSSLISWPRRGCRPSPSPREAPANCLSPWKAGGRNVCPRRPFQTSEHISPTPFTLRLVSEDVPGHAGTQNPDVDSFDSKVVIDVEYVPMPHQSGAEAQQRPHLLGNRLLIAVRNALTDSLRRWNQHGHSYARSVEINS